jgi:hypothetical protein
MLSNETKKVKYLLETLERRNRFFSIGIFFDTMLQQRRLLKLCFEDTAAQILKDNPT